jgi:uncharacterized protein YceH (UPF0502 family)
MDESQATSETSASTSSTAPARRWQPLSAKDRRVAGVLVEKAKTTPDVYPMTINAIVAGCNQKSNRYPLMNLEPDEVEQSLDRLRNLGAAAVVQGTGRVARYRHYMYEWLGVDKVEMAVMTELLLRGAQTEGELRGRAARMEPIADLAALRPVLESLKTKGLITSLTSAGRGHVVTHTLYEPRELEKLRAQYAGGDAPGGDTEEIEQPRVAQAARSAATTTVPPAAASTGAAVETLREEIADLRDEVIALGSQLSECRAEIDRLKAQLGV